MDAGHVLILLAPFAIAAAWFILFAILSQTVYRRVVRADGPQAKGQLEYIGADGLGVGKASWVRCLRYLAAKSKVMS